MKTAISIPDKIFESAEELASKLGKSRSQLYTQAVSGLIERYQSESVTEKLDQIYGQTETRLDPLLDKMQRRSLSQDVW